uniref:Uncharacterized protein n=1 Tax=Rhizophora mucronata TaxID=61149 RepID=A0A2P2IV75_RHIMU
MNLSHLDEETDWNLSLVWLLFFFSVIC